MDTVGTLVAVRTFSPVSKQGFADVTIIASGRKGAASQSKALRGGV